MNFFVSWIAGPLAVALGLVAAAFAMIVVTPGGALLAFGLHLAAAALAIVASSRRRGGLMPAERDAAWVAALLVPCFGAALAWIGPRGRNAESMANAHEAFEHYEARVRPAAISRDRTLLTGEHDRDVAREIDVRRHQRVLRAGSTVERLNALRCLARLGRPRDMRLVRAALTDHEEEVRLFAHALLDGLMEQHGLRIVAARERFASDTEDPDAAFELARAHFDLAASGALDARTSQYHYRCAGRIASGAAGDADAERVCLRALALARTGDTDAANAELDALSADACTARETRLVMAEVAYLSRDFARAREQHAALAATDSEVPVWLGALAGVQGSAA